MDLALGAIGLVLATPLTVCLVVLGKYVPEMEFITVLMSDEATPEAKIVFYQRLLARDKDEAGRLVADYLTNHPREQLYEEVLVPALYYARGERERSRLTDSDAQWIFHATREIVTKLAYEQQARPGPTNDGEFSVIENCELRKIRIFGCSAKDQADQVALFMFQQLLDPNLCEIEIVGEKKLTSEVVAMALEKKSELVLIGAVRPDGLVEARHLCKRIQSISPKPKIVVGRWGSKEDEDKKETNLLLSEGADQVAITLVDARDKIMNLRGLVLGTRR